MMNHGYDEESMSKQREAIAKLKKEIQKQNQKFIDMEHKHTEKTVITRKLIVELLERQRSLLEMENKYNDSLNMIIRLTGEEDTTHEECHLELQELKVVNSDISRDLEFIKTQHEQLSKELKEIKNLFDLQKKNFAEAMQKNIVEISSLQFAAVKQQNDYKNLLNLAEDLKKQNERLNAKIIHLEQENRRVEKEKLDGLEGHQFKKVNFYKSLSSEEKRTRKQELELDKRAHTPKLKEVEGKKGIEEDDQEVEDTEEEDQDGEENQEVENVEEENQEEDQEEREDEKLVGRLLEDVKEENEQLSFKKFQLDQENQIIRKGKLDDLEGHEFKEVHFYNSISFEGEWIMKQVELHKFKEVHFDNSISFEEERIMKQDVELYKLTHAFDQERQEDDNDDDGNEDGEDDSDNNEDDEDDSDNNEDDEDDDNDEYHNGDYNLEGHQFKETHFYNSVIFEKEWTMRPEVKIHKLIHAFEQERHEEADHKYDNKDNDKNTNNYNESEDNNDEDECDNDHEDHNDEDECDNDHEDHNDAYDLEGHQFKETHFYNSVTLEEEWTMRQDVELHKLTHVFEQELHEKDDDNEDNDKDIDDNNEHGDGDADYHDDHNDEDENHDYHEDHNDEDEGHDYHNNNYDICDNEDHNESYDNYDNDGNYDNDSYSDY